MQCDERSVRPKGACGAVNAQDELGYTALHHAALNSNLYALLAHCTVRRTLYTHDNVFVLELDSIDVASSMLLYFLLLNVTCDL